MPSKHDLPPLQGEDAAGGLTHLPWRLPVVFLAALLALSCGGNGDDPDGDADADTDADADGDTDADSDVDSDVDADADSDPDADVVTDADTSADADPPTDAAPDADAPPPPFVVVTFNTGTTDGMLHDLPPDDGYTSDHAEISNDHYGNGLAWVPAVEAVTAFFAALEPDVVVFQEIFYSEDCATVPADAREDFVCETWTAGDPTVAQVVLGAGYQVMCHPTKPDACAAVRRSFGSFRGCSEDYCLEGMTGFPVPDCGGGARVGRAVIDLVAGGSITLVNVHGTSGVDGDDTDCRVEQVNQVFVDLGDGAPGASGETNLVMGDLNTDPGRNALLDASARRWSSFVGPSHDFHFITDVGFSAAPTYTGLLNIDHVISDDLVGDCWVAGVTAGHPAVIDATYFDHKPHVCTVELSAE